MGNSRRFRLSHVMPNVWFYKLRDIGRYSAESQKRRLAQPTYNTSTRLDETAISFPRSSHHFGRRERVYNHKSSAEQAARCRAQPQMVENESMQPKTSEGKMKNKGGSSSTSTVRNSRISAGCSCRATVDSVWESRETLRNDFSISGEEEQEPVRYYSKPSRKNCRTQFTDRLDPAQLSPQSESKCGNSMQPSHHFNYVAGLPSPVKEYEDFRRVQPLAQKVTEMFELGGNPFVPDSSLTRSNSYNSCGLSSVSSIDQKALLVSSEDELSVSFIDMKSSALSTEVKQKELFLEYLEECRPSMTRPRDFQYGIKEKNQKEGLEKKAVPARKEFNAGQMQLSAASVTNFNTQAPRQLGKSRSQIHYKNRTRVFSPKLDGIYYNAKLRSKGTKSEQKGAEAQLSDKCRIVSSDMNSVKCGESGGSIAVCDSFVVVKSSRDPQKDFRESMVEMIKENNIHYHRDLQRLLRCYISLNAVENHDIIVKAFEQIRSDFAEMPS